MDKLQVGIKKMQNQSIRLYLLFLFIVAATILSAFILALLYKQFAPVSLLDPSLIISRYQPGLMPKPRERFVFLILAFTVPFISFSVAYAFFRGACQQFIPTKTNLNFLILGTAAVLFLPFVRFDFSQELIHTGVRLPTEHPILTLTMTFIFASGWYFWQWLHNVNSLRINHKATVFIWVTFSLAIVLQISAWRIFSERSITQYSIWHVSADAVFYAISQVMGGKTLLVDLPSQYGLYPELIAPIFKLTGFSILKFTVFCAILQVISLFAVYWVVSRVVRDNAIKLAFSIALVMVTFGTVVLLINIGDQYFQYWPIRFFWPAMAVLFFYRYSIKTTAWRAFQVSLIGAVGSVWNMDSGVMIVISFAGVLIAKWFALRWSGNCQSNVMIRRHIVHGLFIHIATFVILVCLMFGYLYLKGDGPINWNWLFEYQKIFYGLGFGMLPMPLYPYPWMSILGIYLIALLVAVQSWVTKPQDKNSDLLAFISLLGFGLFLYYEGRSHPLNLITVCWPALMLIAIVADRVLRAVRTNIMSWQHILFPILALSVLLFCCIPFVSFINQLMNKAIVQLEARKESEDELVSDELAFIRKHSKPGDECLILSLRQGIYYAATGLRSPIAGPGYVETILQRDRDAFLNKLIHQRFKCIFVGTGESSALNLSINPMTVLHDYKTVAHNSHQSMLYLQPRT